MHINSRERYMKYHPTTQAGAAVAQALIMAAPLQFPPLCGVSSAGGPQPVGRISP